MISLLTYGFITLFTGLVLFGHVLLLSDIFFGGPSKRQPARRFNNGGMRHQKAA